MCRGRVIQERVKGGGGEVYLYKRNSYILKDLTYRKCLKKNLTEELKTHIYMREIGV